MRKVVTAVFIVCSVLLTSYAATRRPTNQLADQIVAMERAALTNWVHGDPGPLCDLYRVDITFFDPLQERRVDGLEQLREYLNKMKGKISKTDLHFEMVDPKVQTHGDTAILTFNLVDYGKRLDQAFEGASERWNATEVYTRAGGKWRIIHSHWSLSHSQTK